MGDPPTPHLTHDAIHAALEVALTVDVRGRGTGIVHPRTFVRPTCVVHIISERRIVHVAKKDLTVTPHLEITDPALKRQMADQIERAPDALKELLALGTQTASGDTVLIPFSDNQTSAQQKLSAASRMSAISTSDAVQSFGSQIPITVVAAPLHKFTTCSNCDALQPTKICPCNTAWYCDKHCQLIDWKKHKQLCRRITDAQIIPCALFKNADVINTA